MESTTESVIEFLRVRQLNFLVAGLLTLVYVVYQYWDYFFPRQELEEYSRPKPCRSRSRPRSRSHSRSCSRARNKTPMNYDHRDDDCYKHKRGRKAHRKCL